MTDVETALARESACPMYVGFFDVLGFSARVLAGFDEALSTYNGVMRFAAVDDLVRQRTGMSLRVLSDAVVVTSPKLADVVVAANLLQFAFLASQNCLLRGGIAHGLHAERSAEGHLFVVSEALVRAAHVEKTIRHPCIALADDILPAPQAWFPYSNDFQRPLLYYQQKWFVNPLTVTWGVSAATRVQNLKEAHPEHSEKYDWFLEFHRNIFANSGLLPSPEQWTRMGGAVVNRNPVLKPA